jgi:squalene-hopene/tetraprenyl-beta-curcumene cyclase
MGKDGLFYFYNIMTKCLAAYGQEKVPVVGSPNGAAWRSEMVAKLVRLQKVDKDGAGYWVNDNNRFWENNDILVTAYTLIALEIAVGK